MENTNKEVQVKFSPALELYIVQNLEGDYFHAIGYGGGGKSWVNDINKAKIYTKIGQARSRVTWFFDNYPNFGIPNIIKLTVNGGVILKEDDRVKKAIKKKEIAKENQKKWAAQHALVQAESDFKKAQANLKKLKKK